MRRLGNIGDWKPLCCTAYIDEKYTTNENCKIESGTHKCLLSDTRQLCGINGVTLRSISNTAPKNVLRIAHEEALASYCVLRLGT